MAYYLYIMASRPHGAIYIGSTQNLRARVERHRKKLDADHVAKYNITTLVWFEIHDTQAEAATRAAQIKRWRRAWKNDLIAAENPHWRDISASIPS